MKENDYLLLLQKQLSGALAPRELALLEEWLQQSPEHRQLADDMRRIWAGTAGFSPSFTPDLDADFEKVRARIRMAESTPPAKRIPFQRQLLRIAAAVLMLLAAVWTYREFNVPAAATRVEFADQQPKKLLELSDGSKVWLRQGSRLEFPEHFRGAERRVRLDGEAYFEVAHDAAHPFRVETSAGELVEVLGTQFGIRTGAENPTAVLVRSGKVRFSPDGRQEGAYLTAGKKAVYDKKAAKITLTDVVSFNELAWQAGGLEFIHTPLSQVVKDLENWYGVRISLLNPALADCPLTAPLTNQPIDQVLNSLVVAYQLKVQKTAPGVYELSGGICR